jgi:hypothetical protein
MRPVRYLKSLFPLPLKRFVRDAVTRSRSISTIFSTAYRIDTLVEEIEAANAALAELAHRTNYLKLKIEHVEVGLRDVSDDIETLLSLKNKISTLEIELANCRNLAEVSFHAVEALQFGPARTGT